MSALPQALYGTRLMTSDDVERVAAIERVSYQYPWKPHLFDDCLRARYRCFVAADSTDCVIGYALLSIVLDEAHILNLCVDPTYRRNGVARLLLDRMLEEARGAQARAMLLEVRPSNHGARALYSKYGFIRIGTRKDYYPANAGREDAYLLSRRVNRHS